MQVGPCTPVGIQLPKAEVGQTSGPTWRRSHLRAVDDVGERGKPAGEEKVAEVLADQRPERGREHVRRHRRHEGSVVRVEHAFRVVEVEGPA